MEAYYLRWKCSSRKELSKNVWNGATAPRGVPNAKYDEFGIVIPASGIPSFLKVVTTHNFNPIPIIISTLTLTLIETHLNPNPNPNPSPWRVSVITRVSGATPLIYHAAYSSNTHKKSFILRTLYDFMQFYAILLLYYCMIFMFSLDVPHADYFFPIFWCAFVPSLLKLTWLDVYELVLLHELTFSST